MFQFLMSSDVEHRTVCVISWFSLSSTERVNSARDVTVYMS